MKRINTNEGIPIRILSELTGVAPTTLRAWERRYGLLSPQRTAKGHRLYSQDDITLIKRVVIRLQDGVSISAAIKDVRMAKGKNDQTLPGEDAQWPIFQHRMLKAIEHFDQAKLNGCYGEAISIYPFSLLCESLIIPVLNILEERWQNRANGTIERHFFTVFLRNKLGARLQHEVGKKHGSLLIIACLPTEFNEISALMFAIGATEHGYRTLYLGPNSPLAQLTAIAIRTKADAIVLSSVNISLSAINTQWPLLQQAGIPVLVEGPFSSKHAVWIKQNGTIPLGDKSVAAIENLIQAVPPYIRTVK